MTDIQDTSQSLVPPPPPPEPVFHIDENAKPNIPVIELTPETMPKLRKVENVSQEHIDPNPEQSFKDKLNRLLSRRVSEINENEIRLKAPSQKPRTSLPSNIESNLYKEETNPVLNGTDVEIKSKEVTNVETTEAVVPDDSSKPVDETGVNQTTNDTIITAPPPPPPPSFTDDSTKENFPSMMGGMVKITPETMPKLKKVEFKGELQIEDSEPHMNLNDFKNKLDSLLSPRISEINENEIQLAKKKSEKSLAECVKTDPNKETVLVPSQFSLENESSEIKKIPIKLAVPRFEAQLFKMYEKSSSEEIITPNQEGNSNVEIEQETPLGPTQDEFRQTESKEETATKTNEETNDVKSIQTIETVTENSIINTNSEVQTPLQTNEIELESLDSFNETDEKDNSKEEDKGSQQNIVA